ncbi:hypothetical protein D1007_04093 [Hordeum vulgare]|nr:hypothetical protein D1007_04093 [Hordeum vulgare]
MQLRSLPLRLVRSRSGTPPTSITFCSGSSARPSLGPRARVGTGRTRTPEPEARATRRERQQNREKGEALASRRSTLSASVDYEDALLAGVLRRSLTTTESDARRLRRKNADTLQLAIQLSEREAAKEAATKAKSARHAKEQARLLCRLCGMHCKFVEDGEGDSDASTSGSDDNDDNAPSHVDAYTEDGHNCVDDRKG